MVFVGMGSNDAVLSVLGVSVETTLQSVIV